MQGLQKTTFITVDFVMQVILVIRKKIWLSCRDERTFLCNEIILANPCVTCKLRADGGVYLIPYHPKGAKCHFQKGSHQEQWPTNDFPHLHITNFPNKNKFWKYRIIRCQKCLHSLINQCAFCIANLRMPCEMHVHCAARVHSVMCVYCAVRAYFAVRVHCLLDVHCAMCVDKCMRIACWMSIAPQSARCMCFARCLCFVKCVCFARYVYTAF